MAQSLACRKTDWRGRAAYTLQNDLVQLVTLPGGGHIAGFQFLPGTGLPALNPLWTPPWKSIEPTQYQAAKHAKTYWPVDEGKLLAGIAGHNICLDYFGGPSAEEAAQGMSTHGEAPWSRWQKTRQRATAKDTALTLSVRLPVVGLRFSREIRLRRGESVAYITETVVNDKKVDHLFHWTQHVTLGPPFIDADACRVAVSGTRGRPLVGAYGENDLLAAGDFRWPLAKTTDGADVDLTRTLTHPGKGIVASVLLNPRRTVEYVAALNQPKRLLIGYCFRRSDFPWVAIWEENKARAVAPWNGRAQTRGLEFGSTPFPVGRRKAFANAPLFDTPTFSVVPAKGKVTARYCCFLAQVPEGFGDVRDIQVNDRAILVQGTALPDTVTVPAAALGGLAAE